ncbi:hypothetical protein K402DRAFT_408825, partial [Aulographum hederae CBS 113979]
MKRHKNEATEKETKSREKATPMTAKARRVEESSEDEEPATSQALEAKKRIERAEESREVHQSHSSSLSHSNESIQDDALNSDLGDEFDDGGAQLRWDGGTTSDDGDSTILDCTPDNDGNNNDGNDNDDGNDDGNSNDDGNDDGNSNDDGNGNDDDASSDRDPNKNTQDIAQENDQPIHNPSAGLDALGQLARVVVDESHLVCTAESYRRRMEDVKRLRMLHCQFVFLTGTLPPQMEKQFESAVLLQRPYYVRSRTMRTDLEYHVVRYKPTRSCPTGTSLEEFAAYNIKRVLNDDWYGIEG